MITPETIVEFWFGDEPTNEAELYATFSRWTAVLDAEICQRFGGLIEEACQGKLDGWADSELGTRALVLVLDQFPRHAYRGTARQYTGDARALELVLGAWQAGWPERLRFLPAVFMAMPFAHSEKLEHHVRYCELARGIEASTPACFGELASIPTSQATKYHGIIQRFGRFPHRNQMLGRESTPEELEWIASGGPERMPPEIFQKRS